MVKPFITIDHHDFRRMRMIQVATTDNYYIDAMDLGPMENVIYLITDRETGRTAVVDPAWDAPAILQQVKEKGLTISDILLTHSHYDHINGIEAILARYDAQLHLLKPEAEFWG
ncbi:MAG TPA: MBL fold metallo-hydrolase, partial [Gammaproteobacteria bacterium]|nr:MBL fold metallo-hydrolase [Gammaproteobacteria bacterium]